jgi:C1A family cysteine protease
MQWIIDLWMFLKCLFVKPKTNKYGWKRPLPHAGHKTYKIENRTAGLPTKVDLRTKMPPVYDQSSLGSCTANGTLASVQYEQIHHGLPNYMLSRLFQYYNTRAIEKTTGSDSGGTIADAVKAVATYGFCPENMWQYVISRFTQRPPAACYLAAKKNILRSVDYYNVAQNAYDMKHALANGNCIIIGFTVYESFESPEVAKTGIVPMPDIYNEQVMGGHCVLVVGYDDTKKKWIVRNSWGSMWGMAGYCLFPEEYLTNPNLADDFWVIKTVPGAK